MQVILFLMLSTLALSKFLGKKLSEIVVDMSVFGFKEFYFNIIPKSKIKYEIYIKELEKWYLINVFTDMSNFEDELIIFYVDVTDLKQDERYLLSNDIENKIYYLKDRDRLLYKDKLTGLYNKTFFEEELSRLNTKRQLPISLIIGDINGLKLINDAFGHSMGDRALKRAADIMTKFFQGRRYNQQSRL